VTRRWLTLIDRSGEVPASEDLTYRQLLDHLPALCRELGAMLKRPDVPAIREQAARDASAHGAKRWEQGYNLVELIREICLVRNDVIEVWMEAFARDNVSFDAPAHAVAHRTVQRFFDNVIIDSTVQFAEEQAEEIRRVEAALPRAEAAAQSARQEVLRHVSHNLREPLAAIGLAAETLRADAELTTAARDYVDMILRNVTREASYVHELLAASESRAE